MNTVHKALETCIESNIAVNNVNNVIVDKRFTSEKGSDKHPYRMTFILLLMVISLAFLFYDRFLNVAETEVVAEPEAISIDSVLVIKPYEYKVEDNKEKAPESVLDFIDAYHFFPEKQNKKNEEKVVIYEIIEEVDNSEKIKYFLEEAKSLLKADKLTSPKGNNAFERYEAVLALENDNQEALAGINKIINRYVNLAEKVIKKKEGYKVAGLIKSAYLVGEKYQDMTAIVSKYQSYIDDPTVFINTPKEPPVVENTNEKEEAAIVIEPSVVNVDRDIALAASKLIEADDISGAIGVLKRFTDISDYWGQSYDLLLSLYLKQSNIKEAEALITQNASLDTFVLAEKVARLFIASNDINGALNLLDGHAPDILEYNEFYAVKASLYHDNRQYEEAIKLYRRLISIDYDNSRYWLGLAVSLDAVGDAKAVDAFQYAYQYSTPNSAVKDYIEQRMLVLSK